MNDVKKPAIKLRQISIRNYKGIDQFDLKFPEPRMPGDPDVVVLGSENGLGKTAILECCTLLLIATNTGKNRIRPDRYFQEFNLPNLLIRAGAQKLELTGMVEVDLEPISIRVSMDRSSRIEIDTTSRNRERVMSIERSMLELMSTTLGLSTNPVFAENCLMFHGCRRIAANNPGVGVLSKGEAEQVPEQFYLRSRFFGRRESSLSTFKIAIIRSLMADSKWIQFEDQGKPTLDQNIAILDGLLLDFAGGKVSGIHMSENDTVDILVEPTGGGGVFSFDGLSSGQKEIISTLFMVWYKTKERSLVVLLDEPELHLNSQWHRSFVNSMFSLAPDNQYILATHSEFIMDSVEEDRRIFLTGQPEVVG